MRVTALNWPGPERFVISHQNITQRRLTEERLSNLSLLDGLTGVSNRRHFSLFLNNEWRRALRLEKTLSLVMLDIDHFKAFNDNYGHLAGDDCLRRVAKALRSFGNRPGDLVARYGGEEFAVVLADTPIEPARGIAEAVRVAVSKLGIRHQHSPVSAHVTVSVGVATMSPTGDLPESALIQAADTALYESKSKGRNRVSVAE
jgi:diguanylate cyclase (GGDEF)-like protein